MTISRTQELLVAKFKNIPFFVRTETQTEGGRRVVLHEYPNSNQRFVEDLGELPPKFTVKAFVHGQNYQDNAKSLEAALKSSGSGKLVMPTLGSINVFALPYRKTASQTTVGVIEFDLEFAKGRETSAPRQGRSTIETVFNNGDNARVISARVLKEKWDVPTNQGNVSTASFDLLESVKTIFNDFKTVVTKDTELERQVSSILSNVQSIVRDGTKLSSALVTDRNNRGLWQIVSLYSDSGKGFAAGLKQTIAGSQLSLILADIKRATSDPSTTDAGTAIPLWPATTANRIKRNKNRLNLINTTRINGLVVAYEQAAAADYQTSDDIKEAREKLEVEFYRLLRVDTSNRDLVQADQDVRRSIQQVRLAALDVLDQKEQQAFGLTEIEYNGEISAIKLAYTLYAESIKNEDDLELRALQLRNLNPAMPSDKLTGMIKVIQS